jgi:hypothetical protein
MVAAIGLFPILTPRSSSGTGRAPFDSVDACERRQEEEIAKARKLERAQPAAKRDRSVEMDFWKARCIASDDPRLKKAK